MDVDLELDNSMQSSDNAHNSKDDLTDVSVYIHACISDHKINSISALCIVIW